MKVVFTIAAAAGVLVWFVLSAPPKVEQYDFHPDARWIAAEGPARSIGYFRRDIVLPPGKVDRAWLALACKNGAEVIVNGDTAGGWTLWRPTRPFQTGLTSYGQRISEAPPALALNFPREYQWSDHANWRQAMMIDLTPHLGQGRNTIAVTCESRDGNPNLRLEGTIVMSNGERVPIRSGNSWKAATTTRGMRQREWLRPDRSLADWPAAKVVPGPGTMHFVKAPVAAFRLPFEGNWLLPASRNARETFETIWHIVGDHKKGWVRIVNNGGPYLLEVNGHIMRPATGAKYHPAKGDWIAQPATRRILAVAPKMLDPDEVSGPHVGKEFLNPRHGDPTENGYESSYARLDLTQDSREKVEWGDLLRRSIEATPRGKKLSNRNGTEEDLKTRVPTVITGPRDTGDFSAFDVGPWLKQGDNRIRVILLPSEEMYRSPNARRFALDAGIEKVLCKSGENWMRDGQVITGEGRKAETVDKLLVWNTGKPAGLAFPVAIGVSLLFGFVAYLYRKQISRAVFSVFAGVLVFTLAAIVFESGMAERSEILWFRAFAEWRWIYAGVVVLGVIVSRTLLSASSRAVPNADRSVRDTSGVYQVQSGSVPGTVSECTRYTPEKWAHRLALFAILVLAFVLRANEFDRQPLDDDEYSSVQASLSIAEKGVPELSPGVFYTRSPAFHYLTGLSAKIFGPHLWALRLPSILAGVGTVFILYLVGTIACRSRNCGLAAAALLAVHPFAIFTSHTARFYQQQQFFTALTVLFFLLGFVNNGKSWLRMATVICFGLTVLSQEISIILLIPLAICYALFARPEKWRKEMDFLSLSILVVMIIAIDLVVFKVACLTRLEGVSPNVETTLMPHFWEPLNFLSQTIGYSRLHLFAGIFAIIGTFAALYQRDRGMIAAISFLLFGTAGVILLVSSEGFRYQYSLIPLWLLAAVYGMKIISAVVSRTGRSTTFVTSLLVLATILSWSPWRIPESWSNTILGDSSGAAAFVAAHKRDGDKVGITEPHPHAALLEIGQVDYDIVTPILYDFVYRTKSGKLIDRNGGGEVVGRLGVLQREMSENDRIWLLLNREKFRNRSRNFRWEYPGARMDYFIQQNCDLAYRSYLWDVYLWDRSVGRYQLFRSESGAWNE